MAVTHGMNNAHYSGNLGENIQFTSVLNTKTKEDEE
jgi:hypothetical protein